METPPFRVLRGGHILRFEHEYAILPIASHPTDLKSMLETMKAVREFYGQPYPTIEIDGKQTCITSLLLSKGIGLFSHRQKARWLSYNGLFSRINTITDLMTNPLAELRS